MLIEWNENLEIGDPVVDSEHRYLAQLINNLHEQFEVGKTGLSLAKVFTHLAQYVRVHFENEEALMQAINFPGLVEHQAVHKDLVSQAMELSEQYMEGEEDVTAETVDFLKNWAVDHIVGEDMEIKRFLKGERPPSLPSTPAYASHSGPEFKVCSLCGKKWQTFEDLKNDKEKVLKGVQQDPTNQLYNLILFNCSCDTTLGMFLKEFVNLTDIPFEIEEHDNTGERPPYCIIKKEGESCLEKCICKYTQQVLEALD